jgi:molybdenum cofactor cytidylyltransferase
VITAVVLAAGASTRMGQQKLLLPLAGETIVRRTVHEVSRAGFNETLVIVGYEHEAVTEALEGLSCRTLVNPHYAEGMGTSFRTAIEGIGESEGAMFALADQVLLKSADYRRLLDTYRQYRGGIVSVRYGDVTAPPHLFHKEFFAELSVLEHGARPVLERHAERRIVLDFPPELLLDVDTAEDYERAKSLLSST